MHAFPKQIITINETGLWCTAKYEKSLKLTEIPIIYTEQVLFVVQNTKACHE